MLLLKLLSIIAFFCRMTSTRPFNIPLSETWTQDYGEYTFSTERELNQFQVSLSDLRLLDKTDLWIKFESKNTDLALVIYQDFKTKTKKLKLDGDSGNYLFVMTHSLYNSLFSFMKESGSFALEVYSKSGTNIGDNKFKMIFMLTTAPKLAFNVKYYIFLDPLKKKIEMDFEYEGRADIKKLRFQIEAIRKHYDFMISSRLHYQNSSFTLNNVFSNVVGGILAEPDHVLCKTGTCQARLEILSTKTKLITAEAVIADQVEEVKANMINGYYGRTTERNLVSIFELKYEKKFKNMDISVLLVPVLGTTELYVNSKSLPMTLDNYKWKNSSPISKRMTIKRETLNKMNSLEDSLFIAVKSADPSEFYLRIEAHRPNFSGHLYPGVTENVIASRKALLNYKYVFSTHTSIKSTFEVRMDNIQGKAKLWLFPCKSKKKCKITEGMLYGEELIPGSNTIGYTSIRHTHQCEVETKKTTKSCSFIIAAELIEDSSFELSINEQNFHRLLIPGHVADISLHASQSWYFKLGNPFSAMVVDKIQLSVFPHYGSFIIYVSKIEKFPSAQKNAFSKKFLASTSCLDQMSQFIEITNENIDDRNIQGVIYIGIEAATTSSLSLKYVNPPIATRNVHLLPEGREVKGQVVGFMDIAYYRIKLPKGQGDFDHVFLHLTPINGRFQIFANDDAVLPTSKRHLLFSEDNNLKILVDEDKNTEFIVGIQAMEQTDQADLESMQFFVGFSTPNSVIRLQPGTFFTKFVRNNTKIAIEISHEMTNLLIIKNFFGHSKIDVCVNFTTAKLIESTDQFCQFVMNSNQTSIFYDSQQIFKECEIVKGKHLQSQCYLLLTINGKSNERFSIGYTYNSLPFHLYDENTINMPVPVRIDDNINFVYHVQKKKKIRLQFNSRNEKVSIYTKLVSKNDFEEKAMVKFPNDVDFDAKNQKKSGILTDISYEKMAIELKEGGAIILISVRSNIALTTGPYYKNDMVLWLRVMSKFKEIHRSHVLKEHFLAEQWTYFKLFIGPDVFKVRVTISSPSAVHFEARISKGITTEVQKTDATSSGFQFVELFLNDQNFELKNNKISSGFYSLAVKSAKNCQVSLFWNSEGETDAIQLAQNEPQSLFLAKSKEIYFVYYCQGSSGKQLGSNSTKIEDISMNFYVQSSKKVSIYIIQSGSEALIVNRTNFKWKSTVGENGGITSIRIPPKESGFCTNCYYIGLVVADFDAQVTIIAHMATTDSEPLNLVPGVTIPEQLKPKETIKFQLFNIDRDIIDVTVNMLSGFINIYLGLEAQVDDKTFLEKHELATTLQNQKLIIIAPFKYQIQGPHMFYLYITNPFDVPASFCITADKNNISTPIQHGVTKVVRLAQGESTTFLYVPNIDETVEFVFELRQIFDASFVEQALSLMDQYLRVMHVDHQHLLQFPVEHFEKSIKGNKIYMSFDVPKNQLSHFLILLYNPVGSGVICSLNLLNKGYKLLSYNERFVDSLKGKNEIVYEAHGQASKYLFVDVRLCVGDVKIDFYQTNYTNIDEGKSIDFKHLKDANNFIHYIKLESNKMFLRVKNDGNHLAVYELNVFGENEIDRNPYKKLTQGNGGKVSVEWDNSNVILEPVSINSEFKEKFWHRVEYTLYLTSSLTAMKYSRNCGNFMINQGVNGKFEYMIFKKTKEYRSLQFNVKNEKIEINFGDLKSNVKYFGVVIARIDLMQFDVGILTPIRSETSYYDEFIVKTPHFVIPFELMIGLLMGLALIVMLCCLLKSCVFSEVNYYKYIKNPTEIFRSDEVQLNFSIESVLENYYYDENGVNLANDAAGKREIELNENTKSGTN